MSTRNELTVPAPAQRDPNARELIRVWVAERGQHVSLNLDLFSDREEFSQEHAWGKLLSDLTRHLANAVALKTGQEQATTISKIRDAYALEMDDPKGAAVGTFTARSSHR